MVTLGRRWFLASLAGALVASSGCDLASLMFFVTPEAREDALIKHLASKDAKSEPSVVILTYNSALETRAEFIQADRQLAELLAEQLRTRATAEQEKLSIVSQRKLDSFKNAHPSWAQMDHAEIGRALGADYVIYLEINSLSLYEKGGLNQMLLRGRADIAVSLTDVNNRDESSSSALPFSCSWPSEARGPVTSFDSNPMAFRRQFLNHVALELSWHFSRYPKREKQFVDGPSVFDH